MSDPITYEVRLTEPAEIEVELEHVRLSEIVSPEYADHWQDVLLMEIERLSHFPNRHEITPENDLYDVSVRRALYFGPSRRCGKIAHRILFHVIEPEENEAVGLVRVLHIWHGAKRPFA